MEKIRKIAKSSLLAIIFFIGLFLFAALIFPTLICVGAAKLVEVMNKYIYSYKPLNLEERFEIYTASIIGFPFWLIAFAILVVTFIPCCLCRWIQKLFEYYKDNGMD